MRRRVSAVIRFARQTGQLVALAWHAQPACFIGVLVLNVTQGLVPVATAQALQGSTPSNVIASGRDARRRGGP